MNRPRVDDEVGESLPEHSGTRRAPMVPGVASRYDRRMHRALAALLFVTACAHGGTRDSARDSYCSGGTKPHAYAFADQASAEASGCSVVRVYRSVPSGSGGAMVDDEDIAYCCP